MPRTELEQLQDPRGWPNWPWMPLKRWRDSNLELGVMFADDIDGPVRVFNINLFQTSMKAAVALTNGVPCPWPIHKTYTDVQAMLDDGWHGD